MIRKIFAIATFSLLALLGALVFFVVSIPTGHVLLATFATAAWWYVIHEAVQRVFRIDLLAEAIARLRARRQRRDSQGGT